MLFHLLMVFLNTALSDFYAALPPWSFTLGDGSVGGSTDGGAVHLVLAYVFVWDRFIPLHDCALPIMGLEFAIFIGGSALKAIFKGASFIPTIGAGG